MHCIRVTLLAGCLLAIPAASPAQQPAPAQLPLPPLPTPPPPFRDLIVREPFVPSAPAVFRAVHVTNTTESPVEIVLLEDHGLRILARLDAGAGATLADLPADDLWLRLLARRASDHALLDLAHWSPTPADTTWCTVRPGRVRERYIISS